MFGARRHYSARLRRKVETMASNIQSGGVNRAQQFSTSPDGQTVASAVRVASAATPGNGGSAQSLASGSAHSQLLEEQLGGSAAVVERTNGKMGKARGATSAEEGRLQRTESWFGQRTWASMPAPPVTARLPTSAGMASTNPTNSCVAHMDSAKSHRSDVAASSSASPQMWSFSVMCYNILADAYAQYFANKLYRDVPRPCLEWSARRALLLAEIRHWSPDVVCLQEVQHYSDLEPEMRAAGYEGHFERRPGRRRDGCATFWRADRLRACWVRRLDFAPLGLDDNVALLLSLAPRAGEGGSEGAGGGSGAAAGEVATQAAAEENCSPQSHASLSAVRLLVATTHITFDPAKGDIKLG
ncbi:hypothetical protein Agub_g6435, partial [Astrephomene gubernaculifera]